MAKEMKKIMVTGACGQIGTELITALRNKFGNDNVLASDIKPPDCPGINESGPFEIIDVTQPDIVVRSVKKYSIDTIYHMSAILSVKGEQNPQLAWDVNINGTHHILEIARELGLFKVFVPSSIAVFGPETPRDKTPQDTILMPKTIYGITKVAGELLCEYYVNRFHLDVRGCRYPGIISHEIQPGGGTTDYAVAIFFEAVIHKKYTCFLREDTRLPMMYMPDCLKATLDLMEADFARLKHHANFNIAAMSFSAGELASEIQKHIPEFTIDFKPDYRQAIAESWPHSIDDSAAREEWDWKPDYDLARMTEDMLKVLWNRHAGGKLNYY